MRPGTHNIQSISNEAKGHTLNRVRSGICACGQNKARGFAFCTQCMSTLPVELRVRLRQMLTDDFVQAHHDAERHLHQQRDHTMWKDEGVFNMENINDVWQRWGMAFVSGAAIIGTTIYATHLINRRAERTDWKEQKTA